MRARRWALAAAATLAMITTPILGAGAYYRAEIGVFFANLGAVFEEPGHAELSDLDQLEAYLLAFPDSWGAVVGTAQPDGTLQIDLAHNAEVPFALASTVKIVILGAYAREVAGGRQDPNETVAMADVERWYLPGTDGGAHDVCDEDLGHPNQLTLDQVAHCMIVFSDNAAADYLLRRLPVAEVAAELGHIPVQPMLAKMLASSNHDRPHPTEDQVHAYVNASKSEQTAIDAKLLALWADPSWGTDQITGLQADS